MLFHSLIIISPLFQVQTSFLSNDQASGCFSETKKLYMKGDIFEQFQNIDCESRNSVKHKDTILLQTFAREVNKPHRKC